jgi:hypothetical protein
MKTVKGGNPFACFIDTPQCAHWRSKSNVLTVFRESCKRVERKF